MPRMTNYQLPITAAFAFVLSSVTTAAPPAPVWPPKASLDLKDKTIREVMQTVAATYRMNWRKEGPNYVLRDDNLSSMLLSAPAASTTINGRRIPNVNNNNNRRGPVERAPGVYRDPRGRRR